ncbi:MAG: histidine phosphatase family protein [Alphaproteobacteria bacterium]|nr:histidine phosphatase family protein [Alphaproteobacteria bacterium]MDA7983683.1 histidine phosphatase family protein [Alphaproteobacteria bacterium]MDA7989308.1 histidine phosphatase family protein [Alphaproteobacteria bacterium]MDA8009882.1 histidine phosphatase family protein [Alphaproteobacteria bacterium]
MERNETVFWWIRHAPVDHGGLFYGGGSDWPAVIDEDDGLWGRLASALPADALWVTSGLRRARESARAILRRYGAAAEPMVEEDFGEQRFGEWEGRGYRELDESHPREWRAFWEEPHLYCPPGGESFSDQVSRVGSAVERLVSGYSGRDIVVVCHGGTIRAAMCLALGVPLERSFSLRVDNNSLSCTVYHCGHRYRGWRGALGLGGGDSDGDGAGIWEVRFCNANL